VIVVELDSVLHLRQYGDALGDVVNKGVFLHKDSDGFLIVQIMNAVDGGRLNFSRQHRNDYASIHQRLKARKNLKCRKTLFWDLKKGLCWQMVVVQMLFVFLKYYMGSQGGRYKQVVVIWRGSLVSSCFPRYWHTYI